MVSLQMLIGEEFLMIEGAWLRDYLGTDISKADRIEGSGPRLFGYGGSPPIISSGSLRIGNAFKCSNRRITSRYSTDMSTKDISFTYSHYIRLPIYWMTETKASTASSPISLRTIS